jgi:REP element-mobilizing transposase RayT
MYFHYDADHTGNLDRQVWLRTLGQASRKPFLATLNEAYRKTGWQIHAGYLMPNHFHLVLDMPQCDLVAWLWLKTN